jgi:uncharacterized protein (DUF305 family)
MRSLLMIAWVISASAAWGQTDSPPGGPAPAAGVKAADGPAVQGYSAAMKKMMADMEAPYTGDADADFVSHMIPHHQGAIDMAEIELKYGYDPKLKQLAARIIAAQQREIAFMQAWAAKHPPKSGPATDAPHMQIK